MNVVNTPTSRRSRRAFTLVELVLVLALLVVAVSMIAPSMSNFIRGRALEAEARRMIALMHAAQSRAVSEGVTIVFWVDAKNGQYGMEAETPASNSGDPNAEQLAAADNLQISVVSVGKTAVSTFNKLPAIRFLADGTVDENSPQQVHILSAGGDGLLLVESRNRMGYEVQNTGS